MVDCICNHLFIPHSDDKVLVIRPSGKTFITGLAYSYWTPYDSGVNMSEREFEYMLNHLNTIVSRFWPCSLLLWLGYLLAVFTCGLSLMCPAICMRDAKDALV